MGYLDFFGTPWKCRLVHQCSEKAFRKKNWVSLNVCCMTNQGKQSGIEKFEFSKAKFQIRLLLKAMCNPFVYCEEISLYPGSKHWNLSFLCNNDAEKENWHHAKTFSFFLNFWQFFKNSAKILNLYFFEFFSRFLCNETSEIGLNAILIHFGSFLVNCTDRVPPFFGQEKWSFKVT